MVLKAPEDDDWIGRVDETWWREASGFPLSLSR